MNAFVLAAGVLFAGSMLMANPEAFLRLADDFSAGIRRFQIHLHTGHAPVRPVHFPAPPVSLTAVRVVGLAVALLGLAICAFA